MKSCLKYTPPVSPYPSAVPSPSGSGTASPVPHDRPPLRKTVSFCADDGLEQVFVADEWDRTPTTVTPKLSYQDLLELKQLRLQVPDVSALPRQPFTTSTSSYSSTGRYIPSPFATHKPFSNSRWKNRVEEVPADIDPEILPYLEAVPIRLLPLLEQQPSPSPPLPPPSSSIRSESISIPASKLDPISSPEPNLPISMPIVPSPSSTVSGSSITPASASVSAPPTPSIATSSPAAVTLPASSLSPPPSPPTPRRKPKFSFLPLLPVDASPPPPVTLSSTLPPPPRRLNIAFTPIFDPPEAPPPPASPIAEARNMPLCDGSATTSQSSDDSADDTPSTPTLSAHIAHMQEPEWAELEAAHSEDDSVSHFEDEPISQSEDEPESDDDVPRLRRRALLALPRGAPKPMSTPSLSSASDTDTESDAPTPSTAGSPPSSPPADIDLAWDGVNPYFPLTDEPGAQAFARHYAAGIPARARQTPPLFPLGLGFGGGAVKGVKLQALPSPALPPPSPFSLNPPSVGSSPTARGAGRSQLCRVVADAGSADRLGVAERARDAASGVRRDDGSPVLGPSFSRRRDSSRAGK